MDRLEGHTAIVTGAANGIGRAVAIRFAAEGAHVVLADITEEPRGGGETTTEAIHAVGGSAEFLTTDVSSWDDIRALVTLAAARTGRLDVIVNNAAIGAGGRLTETSLADWDLTMSVNLRGVFMGCKAAMAQMLTQEKRGEVRGRIVNISSQHGMISSPDHLAYGVSKAGVVYMTRQIAADYARDGIVCNAVAPGKIMTGMGGHEPSDERLAYARARTPWPRLGQAADVASAVLFLASPEATYITGENLMVDGGWMAS
ncbi:MAG: SDR family oxidoreductase [Paracoccaceae bacterium]|nr:SDR family oxidoreductase [Paracoccaceae bacterium]